ncbi:MAG: hypothetical protein R3E39_25980 [Anaerolineae bacterium]
MNHTLRDLYEEDKRDAQTYRGDEAFIASQARRAYVEELLRSGQLQSADDYYHAAFIFQHGERLEHWAQAYLLARTAADMGHPKARYQAAAAHDRWLMRQGLPQKFGTNSVMDGDGWRVWDIDSQTTDEERVRWDVPPLEHLLARGEEAFGGLRRSLLFTEPMLKLEVAHVKIGIYETGDPPSADDGLVLGIPDYSPLEMNDPCPAYFPAGLSPWRFGSLFCATDSMGRVALSWHLVRWAVLHPQGSDSQVVLASLRGQPQTMSTDSAFWSRIVVTVSRERSWLVGGVYDKSELARVAVSLG